MNPRSLAKTVAALALPVLLGGCLTDEQINSLAQAAQSSGRPQGVTSGYRPQPGYSGQYGGYGPGYRPQIPVAPQYQGVFTDGYRHGYKAGYRDASHHMPYARTANHGQAPEAYYSGYGRGYAEGYNEARGGMGYGCSL